MNILLKSMAIVLSLVAGVHAMEGTEQLTPTAKVSAHKMLLMKQAIDDGELPWVPKDVQNVIGGKLHELSANPVLAGKLVIQ